ncbi:MAG: hypothetical protein QOG12_1246 [Verrucomicrobiota bacterium]
MAKNHPYISSSGPIVQAVGHLRRSFPQTVTADTLKKLGIAPKNESYLINILRFLSIIDSEGKREEAAAKIFNLHDDAAFQNAFGEFVQRAYGDLFGLHGDTAWSLDVNALITFFRQADQSSSIVGARQANTFRALAALAGHGETATPRTRSSAIKSGEQVPARKKSSSRPEKKARTPQAATTMLPTQSSPFGLTVRVEINLPADATQEAYDKIFQSMRKNLIDGR